MGYMLFVDRFACVGLPCFGYFARHAENCQTIGLDESARYLTNERYTSIFVILFFAFFYIAKPGSPYRQSYLATTRVKVRSTVPAMFVYHTTSHIVCIAKPGQLGRQISSE